MTFECGVSDAHAAETLFHVCRSVALYERDQEHAQLLHASAVARDAGVVAFCGVSGAGKTTLMLHAVLNLGYYPVTNDRMLVWGTTPLAVSFPGYINCCEGTLLADHRLYRAALAFENCDNLFRTMPRPDGLRNDFTKRFKRLYPMSWLVDLIRRPYLSGLPLVSVVFPQVTPKCDRPIIKRLNLDSTVDYRQACLILSNNLFMKRDTAFLPWHGLVWPGTLGDIERFLSVIRGSRVSTYFFKTSPDDCPGFQELLEEIYGGHHV